MKKEDYIKKRLNKYKEALGKCFTHEVSLLSGDQFKSRLSNMDNGDTLVIGTGNHAMFACKESGNLYFYDPNDGKVGFGGKWDEESITKVVTKSLYMPAPRECLQGHIYDLTVLKTMNDSPSEFVVEIDPKECPFITGKDEAFIKEASIDDLLPLILKDLYFKVCLQASGGADDAKKNEIGQMSQKKLTDKLKVFCLGVSKNKSEQ